MNIAEAAASLRKFLGELDELDHFSLPAYVDTATGSKHVWSFVTFPIEYLSAHHPDYYVEALGMFPHMYTEDTWCVLLGSDGSAQLLDRDEEKCRLFATLWELEK